MAYYVTHHDFTHGQIDKLLKSRSDMTNYAKGALEIKNMVVRAGGAAKSRFGTEWLAEGKEIPAGGASGDVVTFSFPDSSVTGAEPGYQMFNFSPSEELQFLIILGIPTNPPAVGLSARFIYYTITDTATPANEGTFRLVQSSGSNNFFIDNNQVSRIKYRHAQNQTDFIIVTGTRAPIRISWDGTKLNANFITYSNAPQHDFQAGAYDPSTFLLASNVISNTTTLLTVTLNTWIGLTPAYVGGFIEGLGDTTIPGAPIGVAKIISVTPPNQAQVLVLSTFDASFTVAPGVIGTQVVITEPAFSATRGHPRTVSFYESRLVLAGSAQLPQSLFMSQIGDFLNFYTGTGQAEEGIAYTIASGAEDQIINMTSGRSLQVFTTTNEFSAPVWSESGLTPETVTIRRQTSIGSANCIPAILDNMTIYTKRGGRAVMGFESMNSGGNTYNSEDISALSSEIVNNPIHMTSYVENAAYDANVLFVINEGIDDVQQKQMIVFESLREQNVAAWTSTETLGEWENVESVGDEVFFITKRGTTPATTKFEFEKMDWNIVMDAAIPCVATQPGPQTTDPTAPAGTKIKTLPYPPGTNFLTLPEMYYGQVVEVVSYVGTDPRHPQGLWIEEATVSNTGILNITIPDRPPAPPPPGTITAADPYYYWIGLKFEQKIQTMPIDVKTQMGSILYFKKKIFKTFVQYYESYPFNVNGQEAPLRRLGPPYTPPAIQLNVAELPYSGVWMTPTMQKLNLPTDYYVGFVREATVLINTTRPLPLTITGITMGVG